MTNVDELFDSYMYQVQVKVSEIDNKINELQKEKEKLSNVDKEVFKAGFEAAVEMFKQKGDLHDENEDEPMWDSAYLADEVVHKTEDDKKEIEEYRQVFFDKELTEPDGEEISQANCYVVEQYEQPVQDQENMLNFMSQAFSYPQSTDEALDKDFSKIIKFLGVFKTGCNLTPLARDMLVHLTLANYILPFKEFIRNKGITPELAIATVKIARKELLYATDGCFDIHYISLDGSYGNVPFDSLAIKAVKIKDIDTSKLKAKQKRIVSLIQ